MWKQVLTSASLIALTVWGTTTAGCGKTLWSKKDATCNDSFNRDDMTLIYSDKDARGYYSSKCCIRGSPAETTARKNAISCGITSCIPWDQATNPNNNICPTRTIVVDAKSTRTISLEQVLKDHCHIDEDAMNWGYVAQCCAPNSDEGRLLSQLGAEIDEFPHQAGLSMGCGGTVYNKRHILTAAHCVVVNETGRLMKAGQIRVQLGTTIGGHSDFDSINTKYAVEKVIVHRNYSKLWDQPEFKKGDSGLIYNDVALLKLKQDIVFSEYVKALEIAPKGFLPERYANKTVIVGWGTTDTGELSPHLQKTNLIIRSDKSCFGTAGGHWSTEWNFANQLLCVGGMYNGVWNPIAGGGDSGGPAVCRGPNGNALLCGISSFGGSYERCAERYDAEHCPPSVYAEVAHFHNWIKKHGGPQDNSTLFRYKLYGSSASKTGYNHQVHITSSSGKPCGGTLIAKNVVVTAAQCVVKDDGTRHGNLKIRHGRKSLSPAGKRLKIIAHESFTRVGDPVDPSEQKEAGYSRIMLTDNFHIHDLAIVKLAENVNLKAFPKLPAAGTNHRGNATELAYPRSSSPSSKRLKLMKRRFKIVPQESCQSRLKLLNGWNQINFEFDFDDNVLCAVERYSGGSTCDRELGGGLLCRGKSGKYDVLCGVQVFRFCEFSIPNAFINMAKYVKWIQKKLAPKKNNMV